MPKRLIINSDDYGRTPDISRGIREAHLHGVVTSTTCMMNIPTTACRCCHRLGRNAANWEWESILS